VAVTLRAGRLRHNVDILNVSETQDDYGESTQELTVEATVFAEVSPMTFRDQERIARAGQVVEDITHRVVIRHREGLTSKNKIRFGVRVLEIAGIANVGERGVMDEILCREVV